MPQTRQEQLDALRKLRPADRIKSEQSVTEEPEDVSRETPSDNVAQFNPAAAEQMDREDARLQQLIESRKMTSTPPPMLVTDPAQLTGYAQAAAEEYFAQEVTDDQVERLFKPEDAEDATPEAPMAMTVVKGFEIRPGMPVEEMERLSEIVHSYIGVIPRPLGQYAGRWFVALGAVLLPVEHDTGEVRRDRSDRAMVDPDTGEVMTKVMRWNIPLIKLAARDDITGMNVVIAGGGKYGKQFVEEMTAIYGPGDWKKPREVLISQEERQGKNKETGAPEPHRMYRFAHRRIKSE